MQVPEGRNIYRKTITIYKSSCGAIFFFNCLQLLAGGIIKCLFSIGFSQTNFLAKAQLCIILNLQLKLEAIDFFFVKKKSFLIFQSVAKIYFSFTILTGPNNPALNNGSPSKRNGAVVHVNLSSFGNF